MKVSLKLKSVYSTIAEDTMQNQALPTQKRQELLEKARQISQEPGVYLMKDAHAKVLYVGKAKNLRNRVTSYFKQIPHEQARIELMLTRVNDFDVLITSTENEALILENTLIKKYKTKFNVRLRDDKTYPYLKIKTHDLFPRLEWTRQVKKIDGVRYFGPFPSSFSARVIMEFLNHELRLRDCSDNSFRHRSRPCILYQMNQCTAPCVGMITPEQYRQDIQTVVEVLEGQSRALQALNDQIKSRMKVAAEQEAFEEAAQLRDLMKHLELVSTAQIAQMASSTKDYDVVALVKEGELAQVTLLQVRGGKMMALQNITLENVDIAHSELARSELLLDFLCQYYAREDQSRESIEMILEPSLMDELTQQEAQEESQEDHSDLSTFKMRIKTLLSFLKIKIKAAHFQHEKSLINVALVNASYALESQTKKKEGHGFAALEEVQRRLGLNKLPLRIECYDISNTAGTDPVASRVVFIDGEPAKQAYRKYKIKTVEGSNDFAMMHEVLSRRFRPDSVHEDSDAFPDLIVVDGGKGQLAQAVFILSELNLNEIECVGLAKARTESQFQAQEVKSSYERIFKPGRKNPIPLLPHTSAYKLLTHIRDEAHRFAITYHRQLRQKRTLPNSG